MLPCPTPLDQLGGNQVVRFPRNGVVRRGRSERTYHEMAYWELAVSDSQRELPVLALLRPTPNGELGA